MPKRSASQRYLPDRIVLPQSVLASDEDDVIITVAGSAESPPVAAPPRAKALVPRNPDVRRDPEQPLFDVPLGPPPRFERPDFWESFQCGELPYALFFRLTYGMISPFTSVPSVILWYASTWVGVPVAGALSLWMMNIAPFAYLLLLFVVWIAVAVIGGLAWRLFAQPLWHARLRYFHNHTFGGIQVLRHGPGVADRVVGVFDVRDFLFSLPRSGRRFRRRWAQNHALYVAYSIVHQCVRKHDGQLPDFGALLAEYQNVTRGLAKIYRASPEFKEATMSLMLQKIVQHYRHRRGTHTFFPIGELMQAVGEVRRSRIYPYLTGNRLDYDLGLFLDALFDEAMISEDRLLESQHHHTAYATNLHQFAGNPEFAAHIMFLEHPLLARLTREGVRLHGGSYFIPEIERLLPEAERYIQ